MGCDLQRLANSSQFTGFNPRTRMRCDRIWRISRLKSSMFQSTHPHGVRHTKQINLWCVIDVSIHAPAWGATASSRLPAMLNVVSIHAPAWGATLPIRQKPNTGGFQSTHPHGVRQFLVDRRLKEFSFNPRTRMGCDLVNVDSNASGNVFQSTHPHGVRLYYAPKTGRSSLCFNPRTRMGCDTHDSECLLIDTKFQSTHPHGVRRNVLITIG